MGEPLSPVSRLRHLADFLPKTFVGQAGRLLRVAPDETGVEFGGTTTPTDGGPWDSFTMIAPDGGLWEFTVNNSGELTTTGTSIAALTTEAGDYLTTEDGGLLLMET